MTVEKAKIYFLRYGFWNIAAFLAMAFSPVRWACPFGCAFLGAAGYGSLSVFRVMPGAVLGALIGNGGLAGAAGGFLSYLAAGFFRDRETADVRGTVSLIALAGCLLPAASFHLAGGTYDLIVCALSSFAAMAACPALMPFVNGRMEERLSADSEERVALFLMTAVCLSGLTALCAPAGYFASGLFALLMAFGGLTSALIGALVGGSGILMGGGEALLIVLLFLCCAAAGALSGKSSILQSALFLIGIPLSVYFEIGRESVFLLLAASAYPWIPRAYKACFLRYIGLFSENTHVYLTAACARRHAPGENGRIPGDAGAVERLAGGRMLFMLADGMGMGSEARKISVKALDSAKNLFCSHLSDAEIVKCINALCAGGEEMHTTLDICHVDLVTGRVKFIKNGAEPAWIVGRKGVIRIEGEALPLGVLPEAPACVKSGTVEPGDMLFMATDGLVRALGGADSTECALMTMKNHTASRLCAEMMKKAFSAQPHMRKDDMSALCARILLKNPSERQRRFLPLPEAEMKKAG